MLLNYITWDVNPVMVSLFGITIRWYGILFAASFYLGYQIMSRIFKKEGISNKELDRLATYMIIGTLIGARLGHCLIYEPSYYLSHPLEILYVWQGGLASHGAAIGIIIAIYLYSRKKIVSFIWVIDRIVIVVALSGFMIRLGNLMNSEVYGIPSTLPWAFSFMRTDGIPRHPTQLYEAFSYLIIFFILLFYYYKKNGNPRSGTLFGMFLTLIFTMRFFIEFIKEPQVEFEQNMILNLGQSLSIPFIILGVLLWIRPGIFFRKQPDISS